jgi:D-arabinan exo alpha-(1,3)/(1,5)-arabinofuranosidase (non-reducing end)
MNLYEKPRGARTRWISFENPTGARGQGGIENAGAKGHAFDNIPAGETKTLLDMTGSGMIHRIWITIDDRSAEMLRSLRIDMFWDGADLPAVSVPFGDFFGVGLGYRTAFECPLFSDPEGRSFNCFVPMPFRTSARITVTNESGRDLQHIFYDINAVVGIDHTPETLYFHACWRRESPNELGHEFTILPSVKGSGRFLGSNIGVLTNGAYEGAWWGEGEVKVRFGDDEAATLCGSGTEDYIGTGWGQGVYNHRTQGCLLADRHVGRWAFYRYHLDDPVFFLEGCKVSIQTIGGDGVKKVVELMDRGVPIIPVSIDFGGAPGFVPLFEGDPPDLRTLDTGWVNFWRQDDWSATAYFYLNLPYSNLPPLAPLATRIDNLRAIEPTAE